MIVLTIIELEDLVLLIQLLYPAYHTLDCRQAIERILEAK